MIKKFTQKDFLARLAELYKNNVDISRRKNMDYAGPDDPFQNFRMCEGYGVPMERGLLVRMSDKMTRVSNLLSRDAMVADESVLDTLSDLANYAMILRMILEQKSPRNSLQAAMSVILNDNGRKIQTPTQRKASGKGRLTRLRRGLESKKR